MATELETVLQETLKVLLTWNAGVDVIDDSALDVVDVAQHVEEFFRRIGCFCKRASSW